MTTLDGSSHLDANDTNNNNVSSAALLSDTFSHMKMRGQVRVDLFNTHLDLVDLANKSWRKRLLIQDIAGSSISKSSRDTSDCHVALTIYAYPRLSQAASHSKRKRTQIDLCMNKFDSYEQNVAAADAFHQKLTFLTKNGTDADALERSYSSTTSNDTKPFLVFINPHAGAGKAQRIFFEHALPVWSQANIPYTLVLTSKLSNYFNYISINMKMV